MFSELQCLLTGSQLNISPVPVPGICHLLILLVCCKEQPTSLLKMVVSPLKCLYKFILIFNISVVYPVTKAASPREEKTLAVARLNAAPRPTCVFFVLQKCKIKMLKPTAPAPKLIGPLGVRFLRNRPFLIRKRARR